jgi:hypothetical protein
MDIDSIYNFFYGLIIFHPFISMAAVLVVGIIIYLKPTEIIKIMAVFMGILIVVYLFSYLSGASKTGYLEKEKGMHKSMEADEDNEE